MTDCKTAMSDWTAVATRIPRPGFFLGDDHAACALDNDAVLLSQEALPSSWDLGRLGMLPLELLHQITADVAASDPRALVALRNLNRATAAVVDAMRDFAAVAAFPRAMAALVLLAPGPAGVSVSLPALAACLRTIECACCRRASELPSGVEDHHPACADTVPFGDCIYLLAPERVCYACFRRCPAYLPVARLAPTAAATSVPLAESTHPFGSGQRPTSICVPAGRYGVLSRAEQATELYDRRQAGCSDATMTVSGHAKTAPATILPALTGLPAPRRYAAVIPGPYWDATDTTDATRTLDRGYGCLACVHTDRRNGHRGWADPQTRYTREGLQRHVTDVRFGGRVLTWRDAGTGIIHYAHDAPRQRRFPPPAEFGATVDMARRYVTGQCVPGSASGWLSGT